MKKNYVTKLKEVLAVPKQVYNTGSQQEWKEFEEETGIILPDDYKEFIGLYGSGGIAEFLWFLPPFADDEEECFEAKKDCMLEAYEESRDSSPDYFKFNIYPEKNGLLPFGYTDNGDELYWQTAPSFDDWSIVVYESASPDYQQFNMSFSEFLYNLITRQIECDVFDDDMFDENTEYNAVEI